MKWETFIDRHSCCREDFDVCRASSRRACDARANCVAPEV
ncbi:MAG: nitrogen fixation protein NifQ [Rhodoferax sp.]|nr:nitrogen fixation protein NifQ [Rhodoferax sp.]